MPVYFTDEFIKTELEMWHRMLWGYIGQLPVDEQHQETFTRKIQLADDAMKILIEMKKHNESDGGQEDG